MITMKQISMNYFILLIEYSPLPQQLTVNSAIQDDSLELQMSSASI